MIIQKIVGKILQIQMQLLGVSLKILTFISSNVSEINLVTLL